MKCKYCQVTEIEWPENYVKGNKPLEVDTHIPHDWKRCSDIQGKKSEKQGGFLWCGVDKCPQCRTLFGPGYHRLKKSGDLIRI